MQLVAVNTSLLLLLLLRSISSTTAAAAQRALFSGVVTNHTFTYRVSSPPRLEEEKEGRTLFAAAR